MLGQTVTQPQILLAKGLLRSSTLNPFSTSPLDSQSPLSFGILTYEVGSGRSSVAVVTRVRGDGEEEVVFCGLSLPASLSSAAVLALSTSSSIVRIADPLPTLRVA